MKSSNLLRTTTIFAALWVASWSLNAAADENATTLQSLSLEEALSRINEQNPQVFEQRAEYEQAALASDYANKIETPSAVLSLVPRWVDKSVGGEDGYINDSFARLNLSQPIYDFGERKATRAAADAASGAARASLLTALGAHRLNVMRNFAGVLLADTRYLIDFEVMTLAFLRFNRLRERAELFNEVAEIDVAEKEVVYREAFAKRERSSLARRHSRIKLAAALGESELIIENVEQPDFDFWLNRPAVSFDDLYTQIKQQTPLIAEAQSHTHAARERLRLAQTQNRARLSAELEFNEYAEQRASRDDARALLALRIPLLHGGQKKHAQSSAQIAVDASLEKKRRTELALKQHVYSAWENLQVALLELDAAKVRVQHRDLYLDKSRALYEMEVRADIGDAQAKLLEATWLETKAKIGVMLAWAELDLLGGRPVLTQDAQEETR